MFSKVLLIAALAVCANAQSAPDPAHPAPEPYSFTYESPNDDGTSSARQETGDANGRITGFYVIKGADGQDRRVDYWADHETGFHAEVSTNEIGTVTHEASEALYRSSAPSVAELSAAWLNSPEARAAEERRRASVTVVRQPVRIIQTAPVPAPAPVVVAAPPVTTEGYVLVPASAARNVGLQAIGPEIDRTGLQAWQRQGFGTRPVQRK